MARKLNKTLVGVLILSIMALTTVTGLVLLANLPGQDPTRYAQEAGDLYKKGEYSQAMRMYYRAFQKDPAGNPEYLVKAADAATEEGDVRLARQLLGQARVKDTSLRSALESSLKLEMELATIYQSVAQWSRVLDTAQEMMKFEENAGSALMHQALGKAYIELRSEDSANAAKGEAELKKARELDPANKEVVETLCEQLWRTALESKAKGETQEAAALQKNLNDILAAAIAKAEGGNDPKKLEELKILQARYEIITGDSASGVAKLEAMGKAEKGDPNGLIMLGAIFSGAGIQGVEPDLARAEEYVKRALEIDPKMGKAYELLGGIYTAMEAKAKDPAEAKAKEELQMALFRKGLENIPRSKHFRKSRDNALRVGFFQELLMHDLKRAQELKSGPEFDEAIKSAEGWVAKVHEEGSPEWIETLLRAHVLSVRGDIIGATRTAEEAQKLAGKTGGGAVERLLADLYAKQNQLGAAKEAIEMALRYTPADPTLHVAISQILLSLRQPVEAMRHLKPEAPERLRQAMANDPNAARLRIEAFRQMGQTEQMTAESKRLGQDSPEDELRLAGILVLDKHYEEAEAKVQSVLQKEPNKVGAIVLLLQIYQKTQRTDKAREYIQSLLAKDPDNREFKRYAVILESDQNPAKRDELILNYINETKDEFDRSIALASFYAERDKKDEVAKHLDRAEALKPDDTTILESQFRFALASKSWERAEKYSKKLAEKNTDGTEGKVPQGRVLLAKGMDEQEKGHAQQSREFLDQAINMLNAGLQKYPNYSLGWTFLADAYMSAGRTEDAKGVLKRALEINPANGFANKGLARLQLAANNETEAKPLLLAAKELLPNDPWVEYQLQYLKEKENPAEGIVAHEKTRKEDPKNKENLIRLARLYADTRVANYEKAAEAYREALKQDPKNLPLAREIANFFASDEVHLPAEGDKLLKDLLRDETDVSKKALVALALGQFYESQKILATADRHYRMAVAFNASRDVLAAAAEFYARIRQYKDALEYFDRLQTVAAEDPRTVQQAQAHVISILLTIGDLDKAKTLIDTYVKKYPDDPQGMIYEGAYHRIDGDLEKAKAAFDRRLEGDPDNAIALWQRGQLYALLGRRQLAIEDLKKAKAANPNGFEFAHRIALANALINANRQGEGISELLSILDTNPEAEAVAEALADAYTRTSPPRYADAESLLFKYMRKFPRDYKWPMLLGNLGKLMQDYNKAIQGYEQAAELSRFDAAAVNELLKAYRGADRPKEIIKYATEKLSAQALDRMPTALASLAWAYARTNQKDKCFEAFDHALTAANTDFGAYTQVVGDLVRVVGKEQALARAEAVSKADENNVNKLKILVHLYRMNDKVKDAIEACAKIQKLASSKDDMVFAHLARGMLLVGENQFEEGKSEYEEVLKVNPNDSMALNNLAYLVAERMNNPKEALPYAKRASRLAPENMSILDTYGWVLILNNQIGEGESALLRVLENDRDNLDALEHLEQAYQKSGSQGKTDLRIDLLERLAKARVRTSPTEKGKAIQNLKTALELAKGQGRMEAVERITKSLAELEKVN